MSDAKSELVLFKEVKNRATELDELFDSLKNQIEEKKQEYQKELALLSEKLQFTRFEEEEFKTFLNEPYVTIPTTKENEWYIAVPKFVRMNLGWLDFTTKTFNVFKINKFMNWLGDIPQDLQKKFHFKEKLPLKVFDGMVLTGKAHQDEAFNRYKHFITSRKDDDKLKIKRGYEFKFMAKLIDDGILPFIPKPIEDADLQRGIEMKFALRDYQEEAWKKFKETGAIGVYWAFSAGKTFIGMWAIEKLKGRKLVVVPTRTLVEQWKHRIKEYTHAEDDVDVVTYHSFEKMRNKEYTLAVFDECHHLPANMFSKMATLKAKYRIGLSGTPYREDGRTDYIFALTGFPVGLSWENLIALGIIEEPDIRLYIVKDGNAKTAKLKEILKISKKTLIFCDSIKLGENLSRRFEIPFVSGKSTKRIEVIHESETTIVSRIGDEGLSVPDIERVIEIDFLFGSRRQEGQRMGRLFHGEKRGEHVIIMTEKEYQDYSKRLYSIYEKGFKIEVVRCA